MTFIRLPTVALTALCVTAVCLPPGAGLAERAGVASESRPGWSFDSHHLFTGDALSGFSLDALSTPNEQEHWLSNRVRLGGAYRINQKLNLSFGVEAFGGRIQGDGTDVGLAVGYDTFNVARHRTFGASTVLLRELNLSLRTDVGVFSVGHRPINWGTGFLVNDGQTEALFGQRWSGNIVERVMFATRPAPWMDVFLSVDGVFRDENANFLRGDRAMGLTVGARAKGTNFTIGLFESARWQTDRPDPRHPSDRATGLSTYTTNLLLKTTMRPSARWRVESTLEAALVLGHTDRPYLEETFETGASIFSGGAVIQVRARQTRMSLGLNLELGYASGDNDPMDDTVRTFSFHSDHQAGLLLFDHILPLTTARSADRLMDPTLLDRSPSGTRFTVAQGGVRDAVYAHPTAQWRPTGHLDLRLGYLLAYAASQRGDLYQTAMNGGYPTSIGGKNEGGRLYGHEFDASLRVRYPGGATLQGIRRKGNHILAGVEAAVFIPGAAFECVIDKPVSIFRLFTELNWGAKGQ